jgi:3-isopropylmalate dehydratase small subunit
VQEVLEGRAWVFGEDVSTDHIIAGRYLGSTDAKVFAAHAMENVDAAWAGKVRPGDLLVAGKNFGCGSSREQAPLALQTLGIAAIVAPTFARIFFRNAINLGLPVVECPGIGGQVREGEVVTVDLPRGEVRVGSRRFAANPHPPHILAILRAGGLVPKLRAELAAKSS